MSAATKKNKTARAKAAAARLHKENRAFRLVHGRRRKVGPKVVIA